MFKCPKCKTNMVYEWLLGKVMCLTPTCGFTTTWEEAMEHCTELSKTVYYYCWFCKDLKWCTIESESIRCATCKTFLEPVENLEINMLELTTENAKALAEKVMKNPPTPQNQFPEAFDEHGKLKVLEGK